MALTKMIELNSSNYLIVCDEIKIPFHDLDSGNVVWHGRYFKYFESARTLPPVDDPLLIDSSFLPR